MRQTCCVPIDDRTEPRNCYEPILAPHHPMLSRADWVRNATRPSNRCEAVLTSCVNSAHHWRHAVCLSFRLISRPNWLFKADPAGVGKGMSFQAELHTLIGISTCVGMAKGCWPSVGLSTAVDTRHLCWCLLLRKPQPYQDPNASCLCGASITYCSATMHRKCFCIFCCWYCRNCLSTLLLFRLTFSTKIIYFDF